MGAVNTNSNDNEPDETISRLVTLSRSAKDDLLSVAGPQGIEVLGFLLRSGFERAQCARHPNCNHADAPSDTLIIAGTTDPAMLALELEHTLCLLKDDGTVVLQLARLDDAYHLQASLAAVGYDVGATVFDLSHEVLVRYVVRRSSRMQRVA